MSDLMCIVTTAANGHKYAIRFDSESLPLLREKLCSMATDDVLDFDTAEFLMQKAVMLVPEEQR